MSGQPGTSNSNSEEQRYRCYVVRVGNEARVYNTWEECRNAIGNTVPQPAYDGFNNEEDAYLITPVSAICLALIVWMVLPKCLRMIQGMQGSSGAMPPQPTERPITAPHHGQSRRAQRGPQRQVPTLAQREEDQDAFWENALDQIARNLFDNRDNDQHPAIYTEDVINMYTHGALFTPDPPDQDYPRGSATAVVWFGQNHPLNLTMKYSADTFRFCKTDARIVANILALNIAEMSGMREIRILSDSSFVKTRMDNHNYSGKSYELLSKLRMARRNFPNVSFAECSYSCKGAKGARTFAGQG